MDKAILKKFAIESKQELIEKIICKIESYYIDEEFEITQNKEKYTLVNEKHILNLTKEEYEKREILIKKIQELSLKQVVEEVAATLYNRIIAIRYMEINNILPLTKENTSTGIRVLSSKQNAPKPEILNINNLTNEQLDINFNCEEYVKLEEKDKFKYILILICKKLGTVIPQVFGGDTHYIDILLPDNLLNEDGFITKLVKEVPENNFCQVEMLGWLYQYYNQTEKDRVISQRRAYAKNEIAYATQIFTPDWIVKYMVENSLGRYYTEHFSDSNIKNKWNYYINKNEDNVNTKLDSKINPTQITFLDPCCGSGHILIYAFEVFYDIYTSLGYEKQDIPELILKNNLFGLDIDDRVLQLSILSVLLKASEYDKNIFNKDIASNLNILSIQETSDITNEELLLLNERSRIQYLKLKQAFINAKEYGSLILLDEEEFEYLEEDIKVFSEGKQKEIMLLIKQWRLLAKKYDIVVTNPPYMNNNVMSKTLKNYIGQNYKAVKNDLFSAFILRNTYFGKQDSYLGYMTPYVWMFISSYELLRRYIINNLSVSSLVQLEYSSFEEATVPICTFVLKNKTGENGTYVRLTDFTGGMNVQKQKYLEAINTENSKFSFIKDSKCFLNIPGCPIAYWITDEFINIFKYNKSLGDIASVKQGIATANNNLFLRFWYEVNNNDIFYNCKSHIESEDSSKKWYPYNKGGEFRKWYGNNDYVINWQNDGQDLREYEGSVIRNPDYFFKKSITWSLISSSNIAFRSKPEGHLFDVAGMSFFPKDEEYYYLLRT